MVVVAVVPKIVFQLSSVNGSHLVDALLSIFHSAEFEFCNPWEMLRTRKGYTKLASKRSTGEMMMSAGFTP